MLDGEDYTNESVNKTNATDDSKNYFPTSIHRAMTIGRCSDVLRPVSFERMTYGRGSSFVDLSTELRSRSLRSFTICSVQLLLAN